MLLILSIHRDRVENVPVDRPDAEAPTILMPDAEVLFLTAEGELSVVRGARTKSLRRGATGPARPQRETRCFKAPGERPAHVAHRQEWTPLAFDVHGVHFGVPGPPGRCGGREMWIARGTDRTARRPLWFARAPRWSCLLYTSPSPRDRTRSRMPSSA